MSRSLNVTSRIILFSNAVGNYVVRRIDDLLLFRIIGLSYWAQWHSHYVGENLKSKFPFKMKIRISVSGIWWVCGFRGLDECLLWRFYSFAVRLTLKILTCGRCVDALNMSPWGVCDVMNLGYAVTLIAYKISTLRCDFYYFGFSETSSIRAIIKREL